MKTILHIVPALPPEINGLGDFSSILADNLKEQGYTDQRFLVRRYPPVAVAKGIFTFDSQNFYQKLSEARAEVIILHYVGYAYDSKGLPFYLLRGLQKYRKASSCRLLVFFHELYASSTSVFKLPFYTHGLQKLIVKNLCDIADAAFTSCGTYTRRLKSMRGLRGGTTVRTGIFSNVPDNLFNKHVAKEPNSMVVFGSLSRRRAVYQHPRFIKTIDALGVTKLYDVGAGPISFSHPRITLDAKGPLTAADLADCLNKVNFGALCYKPHLLGKSGIFSAYAAFGVIPINLLAADEGLDDGLVDGVNYVCANRTFRQRDFSTIREELLRWYNTHNQHKVTETIAMHL